jgi:hypothetical protein
VVWGNPIFHQAENNVLHQEIISISVECQENNASLWRTMIKGYMIWSSLQKVLRFAPLVHRGHLNFLSTFTSGNYLKSIWAIDRYSRAHASGYLLYCYFGMGYYAKCLLRFKLDTQGLSSYTPASKKQVLITLDWEYFIGSK